MKTSIRFIISLIFLCALSQSLLIKNAMATCPSTGTEPDCSTLGSGVVQPDPNCTAQCTIKSSGISKGGAIACMQGGTTQSSFCKDTLPEMSDYLAMAFVVVAGGMIYFFRRRALAYANSN